MLPNSVDNTSGLGYTVDNQHDENELAAVAGITDAEQIVKMDEQKPIHDTDCEHETLVPDPQDTIGDAVYHGCSNPRCGRGAYIRTQKP